VTPLDETPVMPKLRRVNPTRTSFMRYRGAATLADGWTPLECISPFLIGAVLQAEDPRFFRHHGLDVAALTRKLVAAARGRIGVVGASTLTQQLARNLYLTPHRSFSRKLRELLLAFRLNRLLSKARQLELYLNVIEWGRDIWGCAAASAHYCGKPPRALDAFESTFLASLIAAPRSPLTGRNAARSSYVQLRVTYQLLLSGLISPRDCAYVTRRTRHLHYQLATGATLSEAMAAPLVSIDAQELAWLEDVCRALRIQPIAITAADALRAQYGCDQEQRAWRELLRCVGQDALVGAVVHGNYAALQPLLASARSH
jgi:monofunctional glycosyltransferase